MNQADMKNDDDESSGSSGNSGSNAEVAKLKRIISQMEVEIKANRGTISRLASEAEKQHLSAMDGLSQVQQFIKEKEAFETEKREAAKELENMKIVLSETEAKLADSQVKIANLEKELKVHGLQSEDVVNVKRTHTKFKNKLINLLFESSENVGEDGAVDEDGIFKEIISLKDRHKSHLEEKEALMSNYNQKTSGEVDRLESVVKNLERDCRDSLFRLEQDKQKFSGFITQLKSIVGIAEAEVDLGLDRTLEVILLRTNQLSRNETTSLAEKKSQVYALQRKLKSLNENMDSKNLHMDLLRKKVAALENEKTNKSDFEKEKDDACLKVKKMMKLLENYKKEMARLTAENIHLKDRLNSTIDLTSDKEEQQSALEQLKLQSYDLESVCKMLHNNVAQLKSEKKQLETKVDALLKECSAKDVKLQYLNDFKSQHALMMKNLSCLLTKESLTNTTNNNNDIDIATSSNLKTHKNDDNMSVASSSQCSSVRSHNNSSRRSSSVNTAKKTSHTLKSLTLKNDTLSNDGGNNILTEDEIYSAIQSLIKTNKQNAATAYALDAAILDMADGFRSGFRKAAKTVEIGDIDLESKMTAFDKTLRSAIASKR